MDNRITAHVLVKNEDRFIWFAIMSVIDHVDHMIIFDTGSADYTPEIIRTIIYSKPEYGDKIYFEEKGSADRFRLAELRQEMIGLTKTEYFMVLDGDEIWWRKSIEEAVRMIKSDNPPLLLAQHCIYCAKDIRHCRHPKRDIYPFLDTKRAATIRFYSMSIPGIHCGGYYGIEGFFDEDDDEVQCGKYEIRWQKGSYFHTSYLRRSSRQRSDIGVYSRFKKLFPRYDYTLAPDYSYPEVLYYHFPEYVRPPFKKESVTLRSVIYFLLDTLKFRDVVDFIRNKKIFWSSKS